MKPKVASRRIESFGQRFGEAHLYLAYHAAFPLALTPDLLYRLWANFQGDIQKQELKIPWLAVADLLLSSLCDEVGHELYEMDTAVRNVLLRELKENPRFGEKRINELSDFLLTYVRQQIESHDPDIRDFAQAQMWTALAYTRPSEAARELALILSKLKLEEKAEWVRMASIIDTFAEPLVEFQPLLIYARGMTNFVRGNQDVATIEFSKLSKQGYQVKVADVTLSVPLKNPALYISSELPAATASGTKNWAIVIGINQYDYMLPLNYAKRDAQLMQEFLGNEAGFERIFLFSDDSPDINGKSTRTTRTNLLRVLRQLFENPFMGAGDNFWFFFSGHGTRYADRDYLMPCDGDPEDIENTAIAINFVAERLRRCGADNIVLIVDASRNEDKKTGERIGRQTAQEARQQEIISIFSSTPQEYSYEIDALQQGAFTRALLEGLGIQGKCATVERLDQYLKFRVPELVRQYKNTRQTPYVIAEPVNKYHLILMPRYATLADIATLKNDAYQAEVNRNLDLAEQLWIRVLAAASGQDMEAVKGLQRIERLR
ncbi:MULTISPECIES: caspase family protein [unclassified Nostoc]|uniref:caspase family protein n=1 Tax=unclassified Nostoc TaxID=2593658 RepID=UPI002633A6B7|nr:caspase family protein [Nostoc sp. S13]MDF5737124.1 caspase family protein [Nostoc sp. S13]